MREVYERKNYKNNKNLEFLKAVYPCPRSIEININNSKDLLNLLFEYGQNKFIETLENTAKENYIKLKFYDLKRNHYKNQVYLNNSYLLTTDKLNNNSLEWDYNLLKTIGFTEYSIKGILRKLYTANE